MVGIQANTPLIVCQVMNRYTHKIIRIIKKGNTEKVNTDSNSNSNGFYRGCIQNNI